MTAAMSDLSALKPRGTRIAWIDYAKGVCIILVVMMHSTLGVETALGARGLLHYVVDLVAPFRMPAFFMMSGLLLSRSIDQPWRVYLDRKVAHFAYFYLLWLAIACVLKFGAAGPAAVANEYLHGLIEPFGTLWFIYILPLFFVATKLGQSQPALLLAFALVLNLAAPRTGWEVADEFAGRYVYFVAGYLGVHYAMALADRAARHRAAASLALGVSAAFAVCAYATGLFAPLPGAGAALTLGLAGSLAVIVVSALLAERNALAGVRVCGANSLTIYLAFFAPMALTRVLITRIAPEIGPTVASALVTLAAVIIPLAIERTTRETPLRFLFQRPASMKLAARAKPQAG